MHGYSSHWGQTSTPFVLAQFLILQSAGPPLPVLHVQSNVASFCRNCQKGGAFTGWDSVNLTSYGIKVSADFYIGIEWRAALNPYLGVDRSNPDGRSWNFTGAEWTQNTAEDYMIRAVIETSADLFLGPNQDQPGSDGIGDNPYYIKDGNIDRYPLMLPRASLRGDVNGDGVVNIIDIFIVASAFGSTSGDSRWNPLADIDGNGVVNIVDLFIVAVEFGRTD